MVQNSETTMRTSSSSIHSEVLTETKTVTKILVILIEIVSVHVHIHINGYMLQNSVYSMYKICFICVFLAFKYKVG